MKPQHCYFLHRALLQTGWAENVRVSVADGIITHLEYNATQQQGDESLGTVIPGIPNIHSHAFQRVMAGLTEHKVSAVDTFWTWRETMYRFANAVSPEDLNHIAAQLYIEMVKMGYTSVAEFHYLHHQADGKPYNRLGELSYAILDAAAIAGINIRLLPTLYLASNFGHTPLEPRQKRFGNAINVYFQLMREVKQHCTKHNQHHIGMAFHSLRAVPQEAMKEAITEFRSMDSEAPIHIHIAEQTQEIEQSLAWSGKRPVEWLFENHNVDHKWCLVHATHLTEQETSTLAKSGAVAGICPTTEANLGDGIFPLKRYLEEGGSIAIGSDGNTSVNPIEELRWLEYVQRLASHNRNIVSDENNRHAGSNLLSRCFTGGAKALGKKVGCIAKNYRADWLVIDDNAATLVNTPIECLIDTIVFSGNQPIVKDVMISGQWCVRDFIHRHEAEVKEKFINVTKKLRN